MFTKWFDCYLFHYKTGSYIPKHKDPSCGKKIFRLNFEIVKAKVGGQFICDKMIWSFCNRVYLFRADTSYHYVTPIGVGSRWIFSMGFKVKKNKISAI